MRIFKISDIVRDHRGTCWRDILSVYEGNGSGIGIFSADKFGFYLLAYSHLLVISGTAEVLVNQTPYLLKPGTLLTTSPLNLVSYKRVDSNFRFKVLALEKGLIDALPSIDLRPRLLDGMRFYSAPVSHLSLAHFETLSSCIDDVQRQVLRVEHPYHIDLMSNSLARFFLEFDGIILQESPIVESQTSQSQQRILENFLVLVEREYMKHRSVSYYCKVIGVTPQYLAQIVRHRTGASPTHFISELLYADARNLLAMGNMTILQVTEHLGFSDQSAFGKFFRKCSGMSPGEFVRNLKR